MKIPILVPIVAVLILLISLFCVWISPSVQDFMATNEMWNGISRFDKEFHATAIDSLESDQMPKDSTLVAIPYLRYSDPELAEIRRFVSNGGTLLLMDDFGYGNSVLAYLGMETRFSRQPLLDPIFNYRNPALPLITDFTPRIPEVKEVLLNHASTLVGVPEEAVVARSSSSSFLDLNGNFSCDEEEPQGPFTVAAVFKLGEGSITIVSDPSVAINSMVNRFDNFAFITSLSGTPNEHPITVDRSHIAKAPLDVSKTRLTNVRNGIANPYVLVILSGLVIVLSGTIIKKGGIFEHQPSR
jgi:hypothetical protein